MLSLARLQARFLKESSVNSKREIFPDIDHIDVQPRGETLRIRGEPVMLQLSLVPAYSLTIHKTQALSIKHVVRGCLEGVFAFGQVYVLISRVTCPWNLELIGLPPKDLVNDVAAALGAAGKDYNDVFDKCLDVSSEWKYDLNSTHRQPVERFSQRYIRERQVPMVHKTLDEILNPQPVASEVLLRLLDFIDRVDIASQTGSPRPDFRAGDGADIFPPAGSPNEKWWLTEMSRRIEEERVARDELLEEGPASSEDEFSDDELKKDPDSETDAEDDSAGEEVDTQACSMKKDPESEIDAEDDLAREEVDTQSCSSHAGPRLPFGSAGSHDSQNSYHRAPSSSQLLESQDSLPI